VAHARTWTDRSGKYTVEATLVEIRDDAAVLEMDDGRQVSVPIERLSDEDREHVQQWQQQRAAPGYENPKTLRWRIGAEVTARGGSLQNLVVTFPLPVEWPEQKVEVVEKDISPQVTRTTSRSLGGVDQFEFRVPRLAAGQSAHVILTVEAKVQQVLAPEDPGLLAIPRNPDRERRRFLTESPQIEISHPKVKAAADSLQLDPGQTAWHHVETIYDWSRSQVQSTGTRPMKGALAALEEGVGDCEEVTSLFVAMCRLKGVPARCVWTPGHTYPEFYLEGPAGDGHWHPCESLGARHFGEMPTYRVILQKGDSFRMSQKRGPQRYVTPTASGSAGPGGGQAEIREVNERSP
jgi:hypothetical protein